MVAKQIDRYVSRSFLVPFVGILVFIFGLYVAYDLLTKIDDVQGLAKSEALNLLLKYYAYVFPIFVLDSVPVIVVMAAGLALVKMSKRRELLLLKASGISMYRAVAPIFFWALLISLGVLWVRERMVPHVVRDKELVARELSGDVGRTLMLKDEQLKFKLFVNSYDFWDHSMERVSVIELSGLTVKRVVEADRAHWTQDGRIRLEGVQVRDFSVRGPKAGQPMAMTSMEIETTLTPFDFVRARSEKAGSRPLFLTLPQLAAKMRENPNVPHFRVAFHSRLASAFASFVLLLVAIPLLVGFEHSAHSRFVGAVICIFVAFVYHAIVFVCTSVGDTGGMHPVLAGWLPVIAAGPCGIWLFQSMLT